MKTKRQMKLVMAALILVQLARIAIALYLLIT